MRPIPNFKNYFIDCNGNIYSQKTGKTLSPYLHFSRANIYKRITLCTNGKPKKFFVHRLVMLAYAGPRPKGFEVNHKDGNTLNNYYKNLEYVTPSQNIAHQKEMLARQKYSKAA